SRLSLLRPGLEPAVGRALADAGGLGRRHQRPPLALDPLDEQPPALRAGAGVTVQLHPVSSLGLVASAPPASKETRISHRRTCLGTTPRGRRPCLSCCGQPAS